MTVSENPRRVSMVASSAFVTDKDYEKLDNKPSINDVELVGNKTTEDLGLQGSLEFDDFPTEDSTNPVTSGGLYTAFNDVLANVVVADTVASGPKGASIENVDGKIDVSTYKNVGTLQNRATHNFDVSLSGYELSAVSRLTYNGNTTEHRTDINHALIKTTKDFQIVCNDRNYQYLELSGGTEYVAPYISGLGAPTNDDEATNKKYVDDGLAGKAACAPSDSHYYALHAAGIAFGAVDSTSTSTEFTATIDGITSYYDGLCVMLKNGVVTSAAGFTININGLGAKPVYSNMSAATAETTIYNVNYTMMFVYDSTRVANGAWICYRGYDTNTNTIGYQLRTNSSTLPAAQKFYRYRLLFTSADGTKWVPANTSSSTNATASRSANQTPIDPFGEIVYYGTTSAVDANANVSASAIWQEYTLTLGYSFNNTGSALVLPYPKPIYLVCDPQTDGSAIINSTTPYATALPTTEDGKIYIFLGRTYSATQIELVMNHPVYYYKNNAIRLWTGPV